MILLIDNYDSFSYNLYQLIGELEPDIRVIRNDEMTVEEIRDLKPDCIILSPGPGRPEDAGVTIEAAKTLGKEIPVLGVCLGHQAICCAMKLETTPFTSLSARLGVSTGRPMELAGALPKKSLPSWWQTIEFGSAPRVTMSRA